MKPKPRSDDADAFIPDPSTSPRKPLSDDLAEYLGEGFVESVTTGDDADENMRDEITPDEVGGPFVETTEREEFADRPSKTTGQDSRQDSKGEPVEAEAFPTAVATPADDTDTDIDADTDDDAAAAADTDLDADAGPDSDTDSDADIDDEDFEDEDDAVADR